MNKEIVLISAYTPTKEKVILLRNLVYKLKKLKYKVAVCTHSITPQDIIEECDYFFYDKENKTNADVDISYWTQYKIPSLNKKLEFKPYNGMSTHIYPIFKMLFPSIMYLQNIGYEKIHMVEYDSILNNDEVLKNHSEWLDEYDIVGYYDENNKNKYFLGGIQSYKLTSVDFSKIPLDEETLVSLYRDYFNKPQQPSTEIILFDLITPGKKIKHLPSSKLPDSIKIQISSNYEDLHMYTLHIHNKNLHLFFLNRSLYPTYIEVLIDNKVINKTNDPKSWVWIDLGELSNVLNISLYVDGYLKKRINMNNPKDKELLTKYSKILNLK